MSVRARLDRLEARLGKPVCYGPDIEIREGTAEELAALPYPDRKCPLCGEDHLGDSIRVIEVIKPPPEEPDEPVIPPSTT